MVRPLDVTIVSDIVCPWCFIGSRRLEQVLASMDDVEARVTYRPFLLDPSTPAEGTDLRERLRRKYGADPEQMFANVEAAARLTGIPLDYKKITRTPSTLPGHTLLRRALDKGTQRALADALFSAYFLEGRDIGTTDVLAELGAAHGFERDEAVRAVTDHAEIEQTRAEAAAAAAGGIHGVPYFVLQNRLAFSGAQPEEVFRRAIGQALEGSM